MRRHLMMVIGIALALGVAGGIGSGAPEGARGHGGIQGANGHGGAKGKNGHGHRRPKGKGEKRGGGGVTDPVTADDAVIR